MKYSCNSRNIIIAIISVIVAFWLFKDIHYTDDFEAYERYYTGVVERQGDIGYRFLENIANKYNLSFFEFFNHIIFLQLVLFAFTFIKYKVNSAQGMFCTVLIYYVQMANQTRYFLALPLFLIGAHYLFVEKKYIISIAVFALSFSFHNGIITLFSFIPLYYFIKGNKFTKGGVIIFYLLLGFVGLARFSFLFQQLVERTGKFVIYEGVNLSYLASLYLLVMPSLCLFVLWHQIKGIEIKEMSETMKLTFGLSFFSIIWAIISFSGIQIINARYVNALFPIWVVFMLKSNKEFFNKRIPWSLFVFLFVAIVCKYIIPSYLFGFSDLDKIQLIWMSKAC